MKLKKNLVPSEIDSTKNASWEIDTTKNASKMCPTINLELEKNYLNLKNNSERSVFSFKRFLDWLEVSIYKAFIKRLWICLRIMPCFVMLLFHVFVAFVVDVCYMFNIWQRLASVSWICLGGCVNIFVCPLFVIACSERDVELINNALCKVSQLTTSKLTLTLWR